MGEEVKFRNLKRFNLIMGCFHLIQALAMLVLANDFSLPVTYTEPVYNPVTDSISPGTPWAS